MNAPGIPVRPLFHVESQVHSLVGRLTVIESTLAGCRGTLLPDEIIGIEWVLGDALDDAVAIRKAWDAEFS